MLRHLTLTRTLLGTLALIVLAFVITFLYAMSIKSTTERFIRDLAALRVDESGFSDVEQIVSSYQRYQSDIGGDFVYSRGKIVADGTPCTADRCGVAFRITNGLFGKLKLVPSAECGAFIMVRQGRVKNISLYLRREMMGSLEEYKIYPPEMANFPPYYPHLPTVGDPSLTVFLNAAATPNQRRNAYDLNASCMVRLTACGQACDYLPLAWQDWKGQAERNGFDEKKLKFVFPNFQKCPQ